MTEAKKSRPFFRIFIPVAVVVALVTLALSGQLATVRPIGSFTANSTLNPAGETFNKVSYVDGIWDSKVVPTVRSGATDAGILIPALRKDPAATAKQFGHDVGGADNFLIRFSGKVTKIDTSSMNGLITVSLPLEGQPMDVQVQVGPIISGTALRDAVGFITFGLFTNQMQFGDVGDELNNRVLKKVLAGVEPKTLLGKTVFIEGAFTYDSASPRTVVVTPVVLTLEK